MWSTANSGDAGRESRRQAEIACYSCRRRKVKCDRGYPQCTACEQTEQVCNYPLRPLKPGPKIGSLQRRRKRPRDHDHDHDHGQQQQKQQQQQQQHGDKGASPAPSASLENENENENENGNVNLDTNQVRPELPSTNPTSGCHADDTVLGSGSGSRSPPPRASPHGTVASLTTNTTTASSPPTEWTTRRDAHLNIHDLSFILHPSHEVTTPEKDELTRVSNNAGSCGQEPALLARTCAALGVDQATMDTAVKVYFDNMVAISLFHEPSFRDKVHKITSALHMRALLVAILAYSARFQFHAREAGDCDLHLSTDGLLDVAFSNIDAALKQCGDEAPPLCVLQALIIATHCQLTQAVRGKAWRSLGTCIRLAYELNLHLVDAGHDGPDAAGKYGPGADLNVDVHTWCEDEEKRRAWWAIWEMDVFASTIRRTPPAVDWSQMETLLPVEDQDWFQNQPRPSCLMERDPIARWKALQECGNQSAKAWFLVVNSLMKEAQVISSPRSIPYRVPITQTRRNPQTPTLTLTPRDRDPVDEATAKLESLANSVHCFTLALPPHLQYRNQYLGFEPRLPGQMVSPRQLHCGIYNIYVMTQLARLMIYRYDVFGGRNPIARRPQDPSAMTTTATSAAATTSASTSTTATNTARPHTTARPSNGYDTDNLALARYFEATDNILTIVSRSSDDHIRHINPFLSSTIWLASAVQLLRMEFCRDDISRTLIKSKFEVLYMTYKRCVSFWDVHTALQQNLEALQAQLEGRKSFVQRGVGPGQSQSQQNQQQLQNQLQNQQQHQQHGKVQFGAAASSSSSSFPMGPDTGVDMIQGNNTIQDTNNCVYNTSNSTLLPLPLPLPLPLSSAAAVGLQTSTTNVGNGISSLAHNHAMISQQGEQGQQQQQHHQHQQQQQQHQQQHQQQQHQHHQQPLPPFNATPQRQSTCPGPATLQNSHSHSPSGSGVLGHGSGSGSMASLGNGNGNGNYTCNSNTHLPAHLDWQQSDTNNNHNHNHHLNLNTSTNLNNSLNTSTSTSNNHSLNRRHTNTTTTDSPKTGLLDPLFLADQDLSAHSQVNGVPTTTTTSMIFDHDHDWRNIDLPDDIADLLWGVTSY